jgi:hypothetical protein
MPSTISGTTINLYLWIPPSSSPQTTVVGSESEPNSAVTPAYTPERRYTQLSIITPDGQGLVLFPRKTLGPCQLWMPANGNQAKAKAGGEAVAARFRVIHVTLFYCVYGSQLHPATQWRTMPHKATERAAEITVTALSPRAGSLVRAVLHTWMLLFTTPGERCVWVFIGEHRVLDISSWFLKFHFILEQLCETIRV